MLGSGALSLGPAVLWPGRQAPGGRGMSKVDPSTDARSAQVASAAQRIFRAFERYNENFQRITQRAQGHFERRDLRASRKDLVERIELYDKLVARVVGQLEAEVDPADLRDRAFFFAIKRCFGERVEDFPDGIFAKTFYNSVTRRIFSTEGFDYDLEFMTRDIEDRRERAHWLHTQSFLNWGDLEQLMQSVLEAFRFNVPYLSTQKMARRIEAGIRASAEAHAPEKPEVLRVEFIQTRFFQSERCYIVGRMFGDGWALPLILALKNGPKGIDLESTITDEDEVSMIFGFTRSYIFVDLQPVESVVSFLSTLLPNKPVDELYTVLGRLRQGKTERYRLFSRHLKQAEDQFEHAAGDAGLVMLVFTLPSYELVFKLIRDEFGYPKNVDRGQVMEKYNLVFRHDRAGRLIDTQEFKHLIFPRKNFSEALLEDLLGATSQIVHVRGDEIVIDHLYIERRIRPLNLYVREVERPMAEAAIIDYGNAIRDLAMTNIFPGDLLIKNFGVTRHGRVIFYDYDELCLVTECNFRELPEGDDDDDLRGNDEWFYVGEDDVFPEQFVRFLAMDIGLKRVFMEHHKDLLDAAWWRAIKAFHLGEGKPPPLT